MRKLILVFFVIALSKSGYCGGAEGPAGVTSFLYKADGSLHLSLKGQWGMLSNLNATSMTKIVIRYDPYGGNNFSKWLPWISRKKREMYSVEKFESCIHRLTEAYKTNTIIDIGFTFTFGTKKQGDGAYLISFCEIMDSGTPYLYGTAD